MNTKGLFLVPRQTRTTQQLETHLTTEGTPKLNVESIEPDITQAELDCYIAKVIRENPAMGSIVKGLREARIL